MSGDVIRGSASCYSSATPGRAIVQIRDNHVVTDDPSQPASYYKGPGEAPGSLELFLGGIVSCAVLMLERIARSEGRSLGPIRAEMEATRDPTSPSRPPVLDSARLTFVFQGLTTEEAGQLVETFKGR
ncbi:MAG TPA: OsmC family protein [Gaiellaceae bacterium]|nr:OsmC family protein [Gaiellaceae bacterium]